MKTSVGRIVHYAPPQDCKGKTTPDFYAAIITQVNDFYTDSGENGKEEHHESVELATFGPNSLYFQHEVEFSEKLEPGKWTWPPRHTELVAKMDVDVKDLE